MPEPPAGEADLRALAARFELAESQIREMITEAALGGSRRRLLTEALATLIALRQEDLRRPVVAAYLAAFRAVRRGGDLRAPKDLAASLHQKLDRCAQTASQSARQAFRRVSTDNVDEMAEMAVVANVDKAGNRWGLGRWATTTTQTVGRQATSRGLADAVGIGNTVTVSVGQCGLCQQHSGDAVIGQHPLPPYHPNCSCVASAA